MIKIGEDEKPVGGYLGMVPGELKNTVDKFNADFPVGSDVALYHGKPDPHLTTIKEPAALYREDRKNAMAVPMATVATAPEDMGPAGPDGILVAIPRIEKPKAKPEPAKPPEDETPDNSNPDLNPEE